MYAQSYTRVDGLLPWQQRFSVPKVRVDVCDTPLTVPSHGLSFSIKNNRTNQVILSGNVPIVGFYEPSPGAFLGISESDAADYTVTYEGYFIPPESGSYRFHVAAFGKVTLSVGGSNVTLTVNKTGTTGSSSVDLTGETDLATSGAISISSARSIRITYEKTGTEAGIVVMFSNDKNYRTPLPITAGCANDSSSLLSWSALSGSIGSMTVDIARRQAAELTFTVPLAGSEDYAGFYYAGDGEWKNIADPASVLKPKRLIRADIGYLVGKTELSAGTEEYTRQFVGHIKDIVATRSADGEELLQVTALDFSDRLKLALTGSYPDWLDYAICGILDDNNPVCPAAGARRPPAWDFFPLVGVIRALMLRAGIDSTLLQGKRWAQVSGSNIVDTVELIPDNGILIDGAISYNDYLLIGSDKEENYGWPASTGEPIYDEIIRFLDNFGLDLSFLGYHDGAPTIISPASPSAYTEVGDQVSLSQSTVGSSSGWSGDNSASALYSNNGSALSRVVTGSGYGGSNAFNIKSASDIVILTGSPISFKPISSGATYTISFYAKNNLTAGVTARIGVATRTNSSLDRGDYGNAWNHRAIGTISGGYKQYSITLTAEQSEDVVVYIKFDSSGDLLISGASMVANVSAPTALASDGGRWTEKSLSSAIGGTYRETTTVNDVLDVALTGSRFEIITVVGLDGGAHVNGVADTNAPTCSYQVLDGSTGAVVVSETNLNLFYFNGNTASGGSDNSNLIQNGGFESGYSEWSSYGEVDVEAGVLAGIGRNSSAGLSIVSLSESQPGAGAYQDIYGIFDGSTFVISFYAQIASVGRGGAACARIYNGTTLIGTIQIAGAAGAWVLYSHSVTIASAVFLRVYFEAEGIITVYVDDVCVEARSSVSSTKSTLRGYYDGADSSGINPTVNVISGLPYGAYIIRIKAKSSSCPTRIDTVRSYAISYDTPTDVFSTGAYSGAPGVISGLTASYRSQDIRNDCLVVGAKILSGVPDTNQTVKNFAEKRYYARTIDVGSVYDKSNPNWTGYSLQTIVYEPKLSSQARTNYLSAAVVKRYAVLGAESETTVVGHPNISLFSCFAIRDTAKGIILADKLWVTGFTHRVSGKTFTTDIQTTSLAPWSPYIPKPKPAGNSVDTRIRDVRIIREKTLLDMSPASVFDPYESEADRKYIRVEFDLLVDCHLKVEIVDWFSRSVVAVLTSEEGSDEKIENYGFTLFEAQRVVLRWDGANNHTLLSGSSYNANQENPDNVGINFYAVEHCVDGEWWGDRKNGGARYGKFYVSITSKDTDNLATYNYSTDDVQHQSHIYTKRGVRTLYNCSVEKAIPQIVKDPYMDYQPFSEEGAYISIESILAERNVYRVDLKAFFDLIFTVDYVTTSSVLTKDGTSFRLASNIAMVPGTFNASDQNSLEDPKTKIIVDCRSTKKYRGLFRVEGLFDWNGNDWGRYIDKIARTRDNKSTHIYIYGKATENNGRESLYAQTWSRSEKIQGDGGAVTKTYYVCPMVKYVLTCYDKSGRPAVYYFRNFWVPSGINPGSWKWRIACTGQIDWFQKSFRTTPTGFWQSKANRDWHLANGDGYQVYFNTMYNATNRYTHPDDGGSYENAPKKSEYTGNGRLTLRFYELENETIFLP